MLRAVVVVVGFRYVRDGSRRGALFERWKTKLPSWMVALGGIKIEEAALRHRW